MADRTVNLESVIEVVNTYFRCVLNLKPDYLIDGITSLPTVDAAPVKRGRWVRWYEAVCDSFGVGYAPHYKCSECDTEYDQYDAMRMNYCPNCGAKFIEDVDEKRRTR